jgi:hypothetical protein
MRALRVTILLCSLVAAYPPLAASHAQPAESQQSARPSRPLLDQLNRETEALYADVRRGVLRVQMPPPRWLSEVAERESPLVKYKGLDPRVREQLERSGRAARAAEGEPVARATAANPATQAVTDADVTLGRNAAVIIVRAPSSPAPQPPAPAVAVAGTASLDAPAFAPNNIGLVLDGQGHLLVPLFLERDAAAGQPIKVGGPEGDTVEADFVGSDRPTNVTLLRLRKPVGTPVRLGENAAPADGALVLTVSPQDASGRLSMWTGGGKDFAVVFSIDGQCAGVARFGQFLSGRACRLIADQIIRHGSVRRATLGVILTQVPKDDPARRRLDALGERPAMRIDQVMAGSPAEQAGLRQGDYLFSVAGQPVNDIPTVAAAIAARSGPTAFEVLRGEQVLTVTVDLEPK